MNGTTRHYHRMINDTITGYHKGAPVWLRRCADCGHETTEV